MDNEQVRFGGLWRETAANVHVGNLGSALVLGAFVAFGFLVLFGLVKVAIALVYALK